MLKQKKKHFSGKKFGEGLAKPFNKMRLSSKAARQHSHVVVLLRRIIPILAVGLVTIFGLSAQTKQIDAKFSEQFAYLNKPTTDFQIDQPRFAGEDEQGRSYEITASVARQNPASPNLITLESLDGIRSANSEDQLKVSADAGLYKTDDKTLDLSTNVEMERGIAGSAYIFKTTAAKLALQTRQLVSEAGIVGQSKRGTISAEKITVYQDENKVVLEGNVHMRLPGSNSDETEDAEAAPQ